jgi:hypothetical protein
MILDILDNVGSLVAGAVSATWAVRVFAMGWGWDVPPILNKIFFNLRPFYLPAVAVVTFAAIRRGDMTGADYFWNAVSWVGWAWIRSDKDDDDRWKRRREKLTAKVQEAGGKLVVVPVGANA